MARVAYRCVGTGPALVFVHGWPLSGFTFRKLLPYLVDHFSCYLIDVPGGGDTVWTAATDFSWPGQAFTLKAFLYGLGLVEYVIRARFGCDDWLTTGGNRCRASQTVGNDQH